MLRNGTATDAVQTIAQTGRAMRAEEERLFAMRTANADRTQVLASSVTIAGSALVIALAGISIFLVRRSSRARDEAEAKLRDNNLNLETTVDERTADLREANDEIQRFAYIVSHDLRSPLVNIMGFTSELEELRGDIFRRIAALGRAAVRRAADAGKRDRYRRARARRGRQAAVGGFLRGARLHQIVDRQDGPADHRRSSTSPARDGANSSPVRIDTRELIEAIVTTVAHQAAEADAQIRIEPLPDIVSDRLALEQIFSNLIDNALKYLKTGVPGDISVRGRTKLGFAIFEIIRQRPRHRSQGPSADLRSVPPRRNPGQAGTGHRPRPCPRAGAAARRNHVGRLGTSQRQHIHDYTAHQLGMPATGTDRYMSNPVTIIMIEDDEGHARLIERNIRRSGVNNEIMPFTNGTAALNYLFGKDGAGLDHKGNALLDPARSQSARHDRHRHPEAGQGKQISEVRRRSWC